MTGAGRPPPPFTCTTLGGTRLSGTELSATKSCNTWRYGTKPT